jgi:hypothetical protein
MGYCRDCQTKGHVSRYDKKCSKYIVGEKKPRKVRAKLSRLDREMNRYPVDRPEIMKYGCSEEDYRKTAESLRHYIEESRGKLEAELGEMKELRTVQIGDVIELRPNNKFSQDNPIAKCE